MAELGTERIGKLPVFDGKAKNFPMWMMRFKAYAKMQKFAEAINPAGYAALTGTEATVLDPAVAANAAAIEARNKNSMAIAALTMAFSDDNTLSFMNVGMSREWPDGKACVVIKAMMDKYNPVDVMSKAEMKAELAKIKLGKREDPANFFIKVKSLERKY
jgi:hypothetical protein